MLLFKINTVRPAKPFKYIYILLEILVEAETINGIRRIHHIVLENNEKYGYWAYNDITSKTQLPIIAKNPHIYLKLPDEDVIY